MTETQYNIIKPRCPVVKTHYIIKAPVTGFVMQSEERDKAPDKPDEWFGNHKLPVLPLQATRNTSKYLELWNRGSVNGLLCIAS
jgi:hypothetical protein